MHLLVLLNIKVGDTIMPLNFVFIVNILGRIKFFKVFSKSQGVTERPINFQKVVRFTMKAVCLRFFVPTFVY